MSEAASIFFIIMAGDVIRQEWMNVGLMLYDPAGNRVGCRFDGRRASEKGFLNLRGEKLEDWNAGNEKGYAEQYPTKDRATYTIEESIGHAMSCIQIRQGGATILPANSEQLEDLFRRYVA